MLGYDFYIFFFLSFFFFFFFFSFFTITFIFFSLFIFCLIFFHKGGTSKFAWEWTPGYWRGGVPRSLEWKQARSEPLYQLEARLSFLDFNDWVKGK